MGYATRTDVELEYGSSNVEKWADANNNKDAGEISARVAWALAKAKRFIDDKLRGSVYSVPFDDLTFDVDKVTVLTTPPGTIRELTATLAGVYLYQSPRGIADGDAVNEQINGLKDEVIEKLNFILSGHLRLDATITAETTPFVVKE